MGMCAGPFDCIILSVTSRQIPLDAPKSRGSMVSSAESCKQHCMSDNGVTYI